MTIRLRTLFFLAVGILGIWFLYIERAILTPFVLAAIFAYVFNPVINFLSRKIKLPRTLTIFILYLLIVGLVVSVIVFTSSRILEESSDLRAYITSLMKNTRNEINILPEFIRPTATDAVISLEKSRIFSPVWLFSLFPQAISRIISFFIFLFAGFYFLKEGNGFLDKLLQYVPNDLRVDVEILLRKMNRVFGRYLRGQILLVFLVSVVLSVILTILGVRFSFVLAIFSGFAEIVPIIGPIVAGAVACLVVLLTGMVNFSLTPIQGVIIVAITYFIIRQLEDYFVIPHVMGRITNLHPLIILFAVIAGGHIWGILGLILAVPIAGAIKILLEFSIDRINSNQIKANKKVLGRV